MSRKSKEAKAAKEVATLRALQQKAAEMALMQVQMDLVKRERRQAHLESELYERQGAWTEALCGAQFNPQAVYLWIDAVRRTDVELKLANRAVAEANSAKAQADQQWRLTDLLTRETKTFAARAARRLDLETEDAAAAELIGAWRPSC